MDPAASEPVLKFGPYLVDLRAGELRKFGSRVRLQEKPLQLLAALAERSGQVVTREELHRRLWPDDTFVDFETGLNTAVSKLRDALSDSTENPRYIETIPRRGYRFLFPVELGNGHSPADETVKPKIALREVTTSVPALESGSVESAVGTAGKATRLRGKRFLKRSAVIAIAASLTALIAGVSGLRYSRSPSSSLKPQPLERQLTANSPDNPVNSSAISRDGRYLAYGDLSKSLNLLAIDSGETRHLPLAAAYSPADWFPDGDHLLLTNGPGGGDLWKMSTWNSSLRKIWSGFTDSATISPDGSHIAIVKENRELWVMGADGEEPHLILSSGVKSLWGLAWSPNGRRLAYTRLGGSGANPEITIETCDVTGGTVRPVWSDPNMLGPDGINGIAWLADGRIIYTIYSGEAESSIWTLATDPSTGEKIGQATRLIGWQNSEALNPQASGDGKRMIVARLRSANGIFICDLEPGGKQTNLRRFTHDDWQNIDANWSADSAEVFFTSNRNGKWAIYEQKLDSDAPEELITGSKNYLFPTVSAQGSLLYTSAESLASPTTFNLMTTPKAGGARSRLLIGRYTYACGSSPLSSCVLAELQNSQLTLSRLDPINGRGKEIKKFAGYTMPEPRWALAPDGARIAILNSFAENGKILVLNVADGKVGFLTVRPWTWKGLAQISWAANGRDLIALAESGASFTLLSIDPAGTPSVMYDIPTGTGWISGVAASPDGRHIALAKRTYTQDVMLVEKF
jgi:DNA-binding winged helix-turn-helix (wHTH) protein/Tol biopolymer transport system component